MQLGDPPLFLERGLAKEKGIVRERWDVREGGHV